MPGGSDANGREAGGRAGAGHSHRAQDAVAIVGMACVLPGAPDVEAFWANVVDGVDSVTEVPPSRWRTELHFDQDGVGRAASSGDALSVSKWGGFVPDIGFDALAWGIPPTSLASIDPAQLLALHCAGRALDDAGYGWDGRELDRERASVIYATGSGGAADVPAAAQFRLWLRNHGAGADALPPDLDAFLPPITPDGLPGVLTSVIAGRVANRLDLGGKNLTVDSACASVLVALDIARNELLARSSDLVLCGGVDLHNGVQDFVSFTAAQALSPTGRCRSFDAAADGMTLAEGAGCLVLKRLSDAVADDDRIYAVVRGVAGSSDGRSLGLTAPRQEGQVRALRRAYAAADLHPSEVGLVEAHGTGTPTGDRIELRSTTQVFTEAGVAPGSVVFGSVKSNIGHTKCAAGVASLIKTAKALYHGVLPPTLHVERPIDDWQPSSPFAFRDRAAPWLASADERHAGVSAFGFGGTNFHAVLSAPPRSVRPGTEGTSGRACWPAELFLLRADGDESLAAGLAALAARLDEELVEPRPADRWRLRDVAAAVSTDFPDAPVRLAIVATSLDDLAAKVAAVRRGDESAEVGPGVHRSPEGPLPHRRLAVIGGRRGNSDRPSRSRGNDDRGPTAIASRTENPAPIASLLSATADLLIAFPALRDALPGTDRIADTLPPPQAFDDATRTNQQRALAAVADEAARLASEVAVEVLRLCGVTPDAFVAPDEATPERIRQLHDDGFAVLATDPRWSPSTPPAHPERSVRWMWRQSTAPSAQNEVVATGATARADHGLVALLDVLAQLAVAGVPVDVDALHRGRGSDPELWRNPPRRPGWLVNGHCARDAAGRPLPNGVRPADEAPTIRFALGPAPTAAPTSTPVGASTAVAAPAATSAGSASIPAHATASAPALGTDAAPPPTGAPTSTPDGHVPELAPVLAYLALVQQTIAAGSEIIRHELGTLGTSDR